MTVLLNWRIWLAVGIAVSIALIGTGGYRAGARHTQARWDAEKVGQLRATAVAEVENRRIETKRQTGVIDAQNAQTKRNIVLQSDSRRANAALDGLRNDARAATADLPSRSATATSQYAAAAGQLLVECSTAYTEVAGQADGHASDSLMLQQAWPK